MIPYLNFDWPFEQLGLPIHMFGVLVCVCISIGVRVTRGRARSLGLVDEHTRSMVTHTLVAGFIGAHLFYVLAYARATTLWQWVNPFAGISSYGGFAGGLVGLAFWCHRRGQP